VASSARGWHAVDLNGDGYADLVVNSKGGVDVFLNIEGFAFADPISVSDFEMFPSELWMPLFQDPERKHVSFAALNGNGTTDILIQSGGHRPRGGLACLAPCAPP